MPAIPANEMNAIAPADETAAPEAAPVVVSAKVQPLPPPQSAAEPVAVAQASAPFTTLVQAFEPPAGNDQPGGFPFHKLVLTLCGALGVASALRFIVRA